MSTDNEMSQGTARPEPVAIAVADLTAIDAGEVARRNADLRYLARRAFGLGGVAVRFEAGDSPAASRHADEAKMNPAPTPTVSPAARPTVAADDGPHVDLKAQTAVEPASQPAVQPTVEPAVWLWLEWAGAPMLAGLSAAWAGAATQAAGVGLEQLSDETLDLLAHLRLSARLPAGLVLRQAAFRREALADLPKGLVPIGGWTGRHLSTDEASGHAVRLWAEPGFPVQSLLRAFEPFVSEVLPSPLAQLPIALPLVAARWSVDAGELRDLAVGDVLLIA